MLDEKIVIGTANFGLEYGLRNGNTRVSFNEISKIVNLAQSNDNVMFDTAISYGGAHSALTQVGVSARKIITKINTSDHNIETLQYPENSSEINLHNLYGLLIHNPCAYVNDENKKWTLIEKLKDIYNIEKVGFSIYSPQELYSLLEYYDFDIVQFPFNFFDRRFNDPNLIRMLKEKGIEIHVRSVFLQGMLAMDPEEIDLKLKKETVQLLKDWKLYNVSNHMTNLEAAFGFVCSQNWIDKIILGVDRCDELRYFLDLIIDRDKDYDSFKLPNLIEEYFISPVMWSKKNK